MDALHLAIEDAVGINGFARVALKPIGELHFGFALGLEKCLTKRSSSASGLSLRSWLRSVIHSSPIASVMRLRERRICQQQPAAGRDAVGLVVETLGKHFGQIFDRMVRSSCE